jgi:hypothetical protein
MAVQRAERQVSTLALPGARLSATETSASAGVDLAEAEARKDQSVANFGGTLSAVGNQLSREQRLIAEQEKERADNVMLLAAGNKLATWENDRLYNSQTGAFTKKGADSFGLPEQVGDEYQKVASDIEATLGTDKQRQGFARIKLEKQSQLDLKLREHVYGEMQRYEAQELSAKVENSKSAAIANAGDPQRFGIELHGAIDAINTHAKNLGVGPEQKQQMIDQTTSGMFVGVIENLVAQDQTAAAQTYFDEGKSMIKGEALAHLEKVLDEGKTRKESQKKSDEIIQAGGSLSEQLEKARALEDPKLRDAVQERLEHNNTISERAAREAEQQRLVGVYNILDRSPDIRSIPPATWTAMSGSEKSAARSYAEHLAKGVSVETDFPTYYGLMQKAASSPEEFATTNLLQYRATIGETELKQLTSMQGAIVKGEHAKAEAAGLAGFRTNDQILTDSLAQYGIHTAAKDQTTQEKNAIAELRRRLDRDMAAQESLTGKKPTKVDVQSALDKILSTSRTVPGSWWGLIPFTSTKLSDQTMRVIDIPMADRQQIEAALKAKNRPTDDASVLAVYAAAKK